MSLAQFSGLRYARGVLVRCETCGWEIDRDAPTCPRCGRARGVSASRIVVSTMVLIGVIALGWWLFTRL